jgi:hypothetical protein
MNSHVVARLTILQGQEIRIPAEYTVVDDAETIWKQLTSIYWTQLKLNIFEIREYL